MRIIQQANNPSRQQNRTAILSYRKRVLLLIVLLSLVRLILAFRLELGNDEAYYWLYSQYWQWNYFDHPPMVAAWIRLFTANLYFERYEGFIRLGSVAGCALSSWFLFRAVQLLHSERAGWYAAVLYNSSFYAAITAGLYILPDSPQMVFWTCSLWLIARVVKEDKSWMNWFLFGLMAGLCIMSKVHGAFLWMGVGGYALFQNQAWLKKPQLYMALGLTLLLISPIFFWNLKYDFATFRFHSNRVDVDELIVHWNYFLKELASQVCFNNPVNFLLIAMAMVAWFRKRMSYQPALAVYIFTGMPLAFLLLFISLFRNVTLPHWSGPAYVSFLPLAAVWLADFTFRPFPRILRWALGTFLIIYLGYTFIVCFYPGTYGSKYPPNYGRGDISLDMYGWEQASRRFDSLYAEDVRNHRMPANASLVASHWWGAHADYYFGRPLHLEMIGLGREDQLNEYLWTNKWRLPEVNTDSVYCIMPADENYAVPFDYYQHNERALVIDVNRSGKLAHRFMVYRLWGLKKQIPVIN